MMKAINFNNTPLANEIINIELDISKEDKKIVNLFKDYEHELAVLLLENRLRKNPHDTFALLTLGRHYQTGRPINVEGKVKILNNLPKASELLEHLIKIDPSTRNLRDLAFIYSQMGDLAEIDICREIEERGEAFSHEFLILAEYLLWHEGDYQAALEYSKKAQIAEYPPYKILAGMYLIAGEGESTIKVVEKELTRDNYSYITTPFLKAVTAYVNSEWFDRKQDFIPNVGASFKKATEVWKASDDPHQQFLLLFMELCSTKAVRNRSFYRAELDEYKSKHSAALELISLLEGIAKVQHL